MLVIIVCDQANIWFFSENSTDKNKAIAKEQILLKKKFFATSSKNKNQEAQKPLK